jgi:branched-chain amino acid transport system substrate-binding protein
VKLKLAPFIASAVLGFAAAGAAPARAAEPGVSSSEVTIGLVASLTGFASEWGLPIKLGYELAVQEVNAAGGIHGRNIRLIVEDDGWSPPKGIAAIRKLVDRDNVFAISGFVCGGCVLPTLDYLQSKNVPLLVSTSTTQQFVTPVRHNTFMMQLPADKQADLVVELALREFKPKHIGILYQLDAFGQPLYDGTVAALKARGASAAAVGTMTVSDTDFNAQILKFKAAGVDLVIAHAFPGPLSTFMKQAHGLKLGARVVTGYAGELPIMTKLVPHDALEGFAGILSTADVTTSTRFKPLLAKYRKQYPEYSARPGNPSAADAQSYGAALVVLEALRRAGPDLTREKFIGALESMNDYDTGFLPPVTFNAERHDGRRIGKAFVYDSKGEMKLFKDQYYTWRAR